MVGATMGMGLLAGPMPSAAAPRIPAPAETVASLANRYRLAAAAMQAGDCTPWFNLQRSLRSRVTAVACDEPTRSAVANWQPTQVARYGTGAVISYTSAGHPRGFSLSFLLGSGRRFVVISDLDPDRTPGVFQGSRSSVPFRIAMNSLLSALRHRNCGVLWTRAVFFINARPWTNLPGSGARTRSRACRAVFGPPESALVRDLRANPGARLVDFGGTSDWHFFGLRTSLHYYNFVVAHYADQPGSRLKYFVNPPVRVF